MEASESSDTIVAQTRRRSRSRKCLKLLESRKKQKPNVIWSNDQLSYSGHGLYQWVLWKEALKGEQLRCGKERSVSTKRTKNEPDEEKILTLTRILKDKEKKAEKMEPSGRSFRLHWKDFNTSIMASMQQLREEGKFFDVSLATSDCKILKAHRVVIAAGSIYFKAILKRQAREHYPFIYVQGIPHEHLATLLDFMYYGEVKVSFEKFHDFLACAESLKIKCSIHNIKAEIISGNADYTVKIARPDEGDGQPAKKRVCRYILGQSEQPAAPEPISEPSSSFVGVIMAETVIEYDASMQPVSEDPHQLHVDGDNVDSAKPRKSKFEPMDYVRILTDNDKAEAECAICDAKFESVSVAKAHAIRKYGPPDYYECRFCGKVICDKCNFRGHMRVNHWVNGNDVVETYGLLIVEI